jgi:hypothetical protein
MLVLLIEVGVIVQNAFIGAKNENNPLITPSAILYVTAQDHWLSLLGVAIFGGVVGGLIRSYKRGYFAENG